MENGLREYQLRSQCAPLINITVTVVMKTTWKSLIALNCMAGLPTIVLNILVAWTVLENKNIRSKVFNVILAILAFTDLVIGLAGHPLAVVRHMACLTQNCKMPCSITLKMSAVVMICYFMTLCTITVATFERYLAIQHPFFYRNNVTRTRAACGTLSTWVLSLVIVLTSRRWVTSTLRLLPMVVLVGCHVLVILYCVIAVRLTTHRQQRRLAAQIAAIRHQTEQRKTKRQYREYKRALTTTCIVLTNIIFYLPLIVMLMIQLADAERRTNDLFNYVLEPCVRWFSFLQSLVNPIILSMRMTMIRRGVRNKLMCKLRARQCTIQHMGKANDQVMVKRQ